MSMTTTNSPPHMRNPMLDAGKTSANSKESGGPSKSKPTSMNVSTMSIWGKPFLPKWKNIILKFNYSQSKFHIELDSDAVAGLSDGKNFPSKR